MVTLEDFAVGNSKILRVGAGVCCALAAADGWRPQRVVDVRCEPAAHVTAGTGATVRVGVALAARSTLNL